MYDFTDNKYAVTYTKCFVQGRLAGRKFSTVERFSDADRALECAVRQITARDWVANPNTDYAYYVVGEIHVDGPDISC